MAVVGLVGYKEGHLVRAGKAVDEAVEDTGEAIEDAQEKVENPKKTSSMPSVKVPCTATACGLI